MTCSIVISDTSRTMRIHDNMNNLVAEILIHGFFNRALNSQGTYKFRGELFQLAGFEYLDMNDERIIERIDE